MSCFRPKRKFWVTGCVSSSMTSCMSKGQSNFYFSDYDPFKTKRKQSRQHTLCLFHPENKAEHHLVAFYKTFHLHGTFYQKSSIPKDTACVHNCCSLISFNAPDCLIWPTRAFPTNKPAVVSDNYSSRCRSDRQGWMVFELSRTCRCRYGSGNAS